MLEQCALDAPDCHRIAVHQWQQFAKLQWECVFAVRSARLRSWLVQVVLAALPLGRVGDKTTALLRTEPSKDSLQRGRLWTRCMRGRLVLGNPQVSRRL